MVPAYTLPPNAEHVKIMRALVKQTLSHSLTVALGQDIKQKPAPRSTPRAACTRPTASASRQTRVLISRCTGHGPGVSGRLPYAALRRVARGRRLT